MDLCQYFSSEAQLWISSFLWCQALMFILTPWKFQSNQLWTSGVLRHFKKSYSFPREKKWKAWSQLLFPSIHFAYTLGAKWNEIWRNKIKSLKLHEFFTCNTIWLISNSRCTYQLQVEFMIFNHFIFTLKFPAWQVPRVNKSESFLPGDLLVQTRKFGPEFPKPSFFS